MKRNIIPALLLLAALLLSLAACGLSPKAGGTAGTQTSGAEAGSAPAGTQEPAQPSRIVIAIASEPSTLHPFDHSAVVCGYMNQMTYNKLFTTDIDTLEPVPELVDSYTCSEDGLTWTFTLRRGVRFQNGEEMTAADAVASLEYAGTFAFCSRYTSFWETLEQVDDYTFRLTTAAPYSQTLSDLSANSACVLPKSLIDAGHDFAQQPCGTGPYCFASQSNGDSLTFTRNAAYFDADHQPTIDTVIWKVIPEGASRTIGLETGEIDLVIDVEQNDVKRLQETEGIEVTAITGTRLSFMTMNSQQAPFDNILFRKAMNAAVDRQAVLDVAAGGLGTAALSPNPEVYAGSTLENTTPYDPELAAQLLAQSGVDTENLVLTCLCYSDETRRSAEVIQAALQEIGITMEIETLDFAAFLSSMLEGDYQLAVAGYSSTNMLTYMRGLWHSASLGASNAARLIDPEIDALIEQAEAQLDPEARTGILLEICRRTNDLSLLVPLYTTSVIRAYRSDLGGVHAGPSGLMRYQDLYRLEG